MVPDVRQRARKPRGLEHNWLERLDLFGRGVWRHQWQPIRYRDWGRWRTENQRRLHRFGDATLRPRGKRNRYRYSARGIMGAMLSQRSDR